MWMEIGAFSCIEPEAVQFCFALACLQTLAEGCELHLNTPAAGSWCYTCALDITSLSPAVMLCPQSGEHDVWVMADDGMKIKRNEIE